MVFGQLHHNDPSRTAHITELTQPVRPSDTLGMFNHYICPTRRSIYNVQLLVQVNDGRQVMPAFTLRVIVKLLQLWYDCAAKASIFFGGFINCIESVGLSYTWCLISHQHWFLMIASLSILDAGISLAVATGLAHEPLLFALTILSIFMVLCLGTVEGSEWDLCEHIPSLYLWGDSGRSYFSLLIIQADPLVQWAWQSAHSALSFISLRT